MHTFTLLVPLLGILLTLATKHLSLSEYLFIIQTLT